MGCRCPTLPGAKKFAVPSPQGKTARLVGGAPFSSPWSLERTVFRIQHHAPGCCCESNTLVRIASILAAFAAGLLHLPPHEARFMPKLFARLARAAGRMRPALATKASRRASRSMPIAARTGRTRSGLARASRLSTQPGGLSGGAAGGGIGREPAAHACLGRGEGAHGSARPARTCAKRCGSAGTPSTRRHDALRSAYLEALSISRAASWGYRRCGPIGSA